MIAVTCGLESYNGWFDGTRCGGGFKIGSPGHRCLLLSANPKRMEDWYDGACRGCLKIFTRETKCLVLSADYKFTRIGVMVLAADVGSKIAIWCNSCLLFSTDV